MTFGRFFRRRLARAATWPACALMAALPLAAQAGPVTYDVAVNYADGWVYSFSMTFADKPTAESLNANDIGGDFDNEKLTRNGTNLSFANDATLNYFQFDPVSLTLAFDAGTSERFNFSGGYTVGINDARLWIWDETTMHTASFAGTGMTVTERPANDVPEPATWLLLAAAVPGIVAGRRRRTPLTPA